MITKAQFDLSPDGKLKIQYEAGRPSWHQAKAGHAYASMMTIRHSFDEHVAYMGHNPEGNPTRLTVIYDPPSPEPGTT